MPIGASEEEVEAAARIVDDCVSAESALARAAENRRNCHEARMRRLYAIYGAVASGALRAWRYSSASGNRAIEQVRPEQVLRAAPAPGRHIVDLFAGFCLDERLMIERGDAIKYLREQCGIDLDSVAPTDIPAAGDPGTSAANVRNSAGSVEAAITVSAFAQLVKSFDINFESLWKHRSDNRPGVRGLKAANAGAPKNMVFPLATFECLKAANPAKIASYARLPSLAHANSIFNVGGTVYSQSGRESSKKRA